MFQNVNVAKSAPFALLTIYQKSLYPPKVFKLPPFRQITRNSPTIFRFEQREMEPSNFTANHAKIAQFAAQTMNHAKSAQFLLNPTNPCSPTVPQPFLQQISQNSLNSRILRANDAKLINFALISTNLLFYFQTLVRQDPAPCLREFREFRNPKLKFAKSHF